jgi:tetratricopeptide (TPR) repeat protein
MTVKYPTMKTLRPLSILAIVALCLGQPAFGEGNAEATKFAREGSEAAKKQDWEQAVGAYRKATQLDKKNATNLAAALQQRAVVYVGQQRLADALADFTEALTIKPNDPTIYERRAYVELKINDMSKALEDYSQAIELRPNEMRYYLLRSYIYETRGDIQNAMADTMKVLQHDKKNQEALGRKARLEKIIAINAAQQPQTMPPPAPQKKP